MERSQGKWDRNAVLTGTKMDSKTSWEYDDLLLFRDANEIITVSNMLLELNDIDRELEELNDGDDDQITNG